MKMNSFFESTKSLNFEDVVSVFGNLENKDKFKKTILSEVEIQTILKECLSNKDQM